VLYQTVGGGQSEAKVAGLADTMVGDWLTLPEAADRLGMPASRVRQLLRDRKLLAHKHEIEELASRVAEKGLTLIPLRLYFKDGRVKAEIALARGKEGIDKRRALADRDVRREIDRELKTRFRG